MINTEPRFITPSDYYNYWGVDLNWALKSDNNTSNKANTFLKIVEDRVMSFIDSNSARKVEWDEIWDYPYMLENFQKALLTQAKYVFMNTDIMMDSGYDPDNGLHVEKDKLQSVAISEATLNFLRMSGLFDQNLSGLRRGIRIR